MPVNVCINNVIVRLFVVVLLALFNCLFICRMKEKPKVPMPGSRLEDPTPGELRGAPGGGDSEREAEPSAPNFTPTVIDTVGSVGKAELLGRNHGRKKSSRSTLTTLENSGLPSVVVRRLRGSPHSVCDVGQDGNMGRAPYAEGRAPDAEGHAPDAAYKLVEDFTRLSRQGRGGFFSPDYLPETQGCTFCASGCHCIGPSCRGHCMYPTLIVFS